MNEAILQQKRKTLMIENEAILPLKHDGFGAKTRGINRDNSTDSHYLPLNRGFDFSGLTIPFSNHWACDEKQIHVAEPLSNVCFLYRGEKMVQQPIDHRNLSMNFARDGVGFIEAHAKDSDPFFLYYAFAHMHVNMFNNEEYDGSSVNGVWGQGMNEMNWEVGQALRIAI